MKVLKKITFKFYMFSLFFVLSCNSSRNNAYCSFNLPFLPICTYNLLTYEECNTQGGDGDIVSKDSCYNNKITVCLLEFVVAEQCKVQARKSSRSSSSSSSSSSGGSSSGGSGGGGGGGGGSSGGGGGGG